LVSSVKYSKAQAEIASAMPFARGIEELIHKAQAGSSHPFYGGGVYPTGSGAIYRTKEQEKSKRAILLITSDRGLCGSFNNNLIRELGSNLDSILYFAAGKKGRDYLARAGLSIGGEYPGIFRKLNYSSAEIIAEDIISAYLSGEVSEVRAVYSEFSGPGKLKNVVKKILPIEDVSQSHSERQRRIPVNETLSPPARGQGDEGVAGKSTVDGVYLFEPEKEIIIDSLLRRYIKVKIYGMLLESNASEQFSRMMAMDIATDNANELIEQLTLEMNKQRQMVITRELSEIMGATEILQAGG
ncbi:MAG: FoF1 ATP synthase subunit gamma, partial [Elusimicrobiota bacterium]